VVDALQSFGYSMRVLPFAEWQALLRAQQAGNALQPLQPLLNEEGLNSVVRFACDNTAADSGVTWPTDVAKLVHTYLDYFVRVGFLQRPGDMPSPAA